jgi:hypothetical protein
MSRPPTALSAASRTLRLFVVTLAVLLVGIACVWVRPANADIAVGASSADFLSFEIGGKSAGMAGAQTGIATGVTAQFWNPAALATLSQSQVGAMHANWLQDLSYEWLGIAKPMGSLGVGSLSMAYFHTPGIQGVDEFDNPTGEFKVYDAALTAGLARAVTSNLSIGMNAKMIRQSLGTVSATAPAVDFGMRGVIAGTTLGAAVQNLGPEISFDGAAYPMPRQLRFGAGHAFLNDRVQLAADYNIPRDYYKDLRVGTEVRAHPNVSLRVGYRREFGTTNDPATGFSYGLGLHFHLLEVDYALTPSHQFDDVHRMSFGYSFGGGADERKPESPKPAPPAPPAPAPPRVIASAAPTSPAPAAPAPSRSAPAAAPPAVSSIPAPAAPAPAMEAPAPVKPAKPAKQRPAEFDIVLPGYSTESSAQAELKALELLGFRVKDAVIEKNEGSGYRVRLARVRTRNNADDMAASLARMSFRAVVEVVQR